MQPLSIPPAIQYQPTLLVNAAQAKFSAINVAQASNNHPIKTAKSLLSEHYKLCRLPNNQRLYPAYFSPLLCGAINKTHYIKSTGGAQPSRLFVEGKTK